MLAHWRSHRFSGLRPFFCQVEAVETAIWLAEVAPHGKNGKRLPDSVKGVLAKEIVGLSQDAEEAVRQHLKEHVGSGGEAWLSQGLRHATGDTCPFCGQSTESSEVVSAFRAFFSEAYGDLKRQVAGLREKVERFVPEADVVRLQAATTANEERFEFWSAFVTAPAGPKLSFEQPWVPVIPRPHRRSVSSWGQIIELASPAGRPDREGGRAS